MKKYTQEEFDAIERDEDGIKYCPSGDYTEIRNFEEVSRFGEECRFGEGCYFGAACRFGAECRFGVGCSFGAWCTFDTWCTFGYGCTFGAGCYFGAACRFGAECSFGEGCRFKKECSFENGRVKNGRYVAVDRIGSEQRKTYFFIDENGEKFVRAGCWFGVMEDFKKRVKKVHAGTRHEAEYLRACELAELMLGKGREI